jgi:hypothetical protein
MKLFYTDQNGNVIGPILRDDLLRLAHSSALAAETQVCIEGSEEWQSLADILPKQAPVSTPRATAPSAIKQPGPSRLPMILAITALIVSSTTAAKVFWPKPSITKYSFNTPQEAIHSIIALTQDGTWEDLREVQKRQSRSAGEWSYEFLNKDAVEIQKTLEVTGSGSKEKNGNIICFLRLKCSDGVTRFSTTVFEKNKDGDFLPSSYPGYIPSDDMTSEDRRLTKIIKKWETTGALSE